MVITLLILAAIFSFVFAITYTLFFPWWKSRLGRSLAISKTSLGVILILAILHLLDVNLQEGILAFILVLAVLGVVSANLGMILELYGAWKHNEPRKTD